MRRAAGRLARLFPAPARLAPARLASACRTPARLDPARPDPARPASARCFPALMASFLVLVSGVALASWPLAVDGQPLPSLAPMLENVVPGVVNIQAAQHIETPQHPLLSDPIFRYFFERPHRGDNRQPSRRMERSLGSGVVMDAQNGFILTNHHVIENAEQIIVTLADGRDLQAQKVGADPETDVAVIKVAAEALIEMPVGDSDQLKVGDFVVAIGNPFGLGSTVTSGIVSALGRTGLGIEGYEDFIQTDASINPGNSGGALVNLDGRLVGLNTAILARSGGNVGIGFAIPVNMARQVMGQLIEFGEVRRGLLGVQTQDLTADLAGAFGLNGQGGAVVSRVVPDSGAERAGLKPGDVVVQANGREVRSATDLRNIIGLIRVGDTVDLTYIRDGERRTARAEVRRPALMETEGGGVHPRLDGALLRIKPGASGDEKGILIVSVRRSSPAWRIGLRADDRIVSVNQKTVNDFEDLAAAIQLDRRKMLLNLQRNGEGMFLLVR